VDAFNQALQLTPDSVSVCNKLASAYILEGSYSMAVETLKKAVDIDPKNIASRFNLGIAYYLNGNFTAAFDQYQILKEMDKEQSDRLMEVIFSD
jgi:cytochrome c-type biogenesis protein CcmH/NrfG